ncbi:hypothetical protein [Nocardioides ginsengisoli]|uniref:hypothetical protein n=1 Tax=Nocardioides ginsengisoli TaxID=363868 RepID=UPI00349E8D07
MDVDVDAGISRRSMAKGLAWAVPTVSAVTVLGSAAPAVAASHFVCPDATCYSVPVTLGVSTVAGVTGINATNVTMVGGAVTFTCLSQYGWLGGWTMWADSYTFSFTDHADITTGAGLTATTPSPLALPLTVPGETVIISGWPWDPTNDGLLNVGQTNAHHITKICMNYTAIFYGIGVPPVALGTCRFQICYATARVGTWNTISLTKVSGPTPLP